MSKTKYRGGLYFCEALALLFIALKLLGKIDWSWWWVTSPLWLPIAIFLMIMLFAFIKIYILRK